MSLLKNNTCHPGEDDSHDQIWQESREREGSYSEREENRNWRMSPEHQRRVPPTRD
jgi:hypothetical protein